MKVKNVSTTLICIIVAVITSSACSVSEKAHNDLPPLKITPHPTRDGEISAPLDHYLPSAQEDAKIAEATDMLTRQCLKRFGFIERAPVMDTTGGLVSEIRRMRESLFISRKQAQEYGFHRPSEKLPRDQKKKDRDRKRRTREQRVDMAAIMDGWKIKGEAGQSHESEQPVYKIYAGKPVPEYGCVGEARERLSEGIEDPIPGETPGGELDAINFVQSLRKQAAEELSRDPRVIQTTKNWAKCFSKETGLSYSNPYAAARDPKWFSSSEIHSEEVSAAIAHTNCQLKVNFLGIAEPLMAKYEERKEIENKGTLAAIGEYFDRRHANAEGVTSSASS